MLFRSRTAEDIRDGLSELIDIVQATTFGPDMRSSPPILLINNCLPSNESYQDANGDFIFKDAITRGLQLREILPKLALAKRCYYLDATDILFSEVDGIHYDEAGHKQLAHLVAETVKKLFQQCQK